MANNRLGELPWLIDTDTGRPNGVKTERNEEVYTFFGTEAEAAGLRSMVSGGGILANLRRILGLGTSITAKYGDLGAASSIRSTKGDSYLVWLATALRGTVASIINAGVPGNTTTQMLARYQTDVAAQYSNFDTLIFEPGPNDYPAGLSVTEVQSNISAIVSAALAAGKQIVLLTPTPAETWTSAQNAIAQTVRQWILTTYGNAAGVTVVDVAVLMADPVTGLPLSALYVPTSVEPQRIHPSIAGAQVMGRAIAEAMPVKPTAPLVQSLGSRDHFEYLPNSRLAGNNASGSRNFYASAGITVTGGPDSASIAIGSGTFSSATIAPASSNGVELRSVGGGTRITAVTAGSARSRIIFRVGSSDGSVGGTQYQRWDNDFGNATYAIGDHARVPSRPEGILTCITPGATGTASVAPPANFGELVTVGAATFIWQKLPSPGDVFVPEIEYEIESQSGGFAIWGWTFLYRNPDGTPGERFGDCQFGVIDESASVTNGLPGLWMPRRGVLRGLPITLANPGVGLRHVFNEIHMVFDNAASATVRFDRASLRRIA